MTQPALDAQAARLTHLAPHNPAAILHVVSEVEVETGMSRSEVVDHILENSDKYIFVEATTRLV